MTSLGGSGILLGMRIADSRPKHLKALVCLSHFSLYWRLFYRSPLFPMIAADGALNDLLLLPRVDVLTCMLAALVRFFSLDYWISVIALAITAWKVAHWFGFYNTTCFPRCLEHRLFRTHHWCQCSSRATLLYACNSVPFLSWCFDEAFRRRFLPYHQKHIAQKQHC